MNNEILYELIQDLDPILIEQIYIKYYKFITNFSQYIIRNHFANLASLEINYCSYILEYLKLIKKIKKEVFVKFGFKKTLKKIIVQKIIMINRLETSQKRGVLNSALTEQYNSTLVDTGNNVNIERNFIIDDLLCECRNKINSTNLKMLFESLLAGYKPNELCKILNMDIKKIYYLIFVLKKRIIHPIFCKYYN